MVHALWTESDIFADRDDLFSVALTSDVSKTAQPFFERFGFRLVERRLPKLRGIALPNVRMCKNLG